MGPARFHCATLLAIFALKGRVKCECFIIIIYNFNYLVKIKLITYYF